MIRVGGGWDTLEHYLDKHDPCRCGFSGKVLPVLTPTPTPIPPPFRPRTKNPYSWAHFAYPLSWYVFSHISHAYWLFVWHYIHKCYRQVFIKDFKLAKLNFHNVHHFYEHTTNSHRSSNFQQIQVLHLFIRIDYKLLIIPCCIWYIWNNIIWIIVDLEKKSFR